MKEFYASKKPIKKISMTDQVYHVLEDDIKNHVWEKGDKLPSESEIASLLNVNRLTVRLALQKLNTLGFIETRVGEGSFVVGTSFSDNISEFAKYYMDDNIIDDVQEFRKLLEMRCIELAIVEAKDEEFDALEVYCDDYERCQREFDENDDAAHFEALIQADYNFHSALCRLSHNQLYSYAYSMAKEAICRFLSLIISERDELRKNGQQDPDPHEDSHRRLLRAIRSRDIRKCRMTLEDIVDYRLPR